MAHMYPETLKGLNVRSQAEIELFDTFQQQLSDHFTVIHSVAWLGIRKSGAPPTDGEADFVVLHPRMGILIMEVKGGKIGIDSQSGWYTVRRDNTSSNIKDPFDQVRRNKYALRDKIRSLPNWQGPVPSLGHAVAFPDGVIDLPALGPDRPSEIILMHTDLEDIESWIRDCMKFWAGKHFNPPGEDGVSAILNLLRKSWLLRDPRIGEQIGPEETAISYYTIEQFRILDFLAGRPRASIRGCAGSGKTMLAIEKARQLAEQGFDTILTCYNRDLAADIRRNSPNVPRLKVKGFHALCQEYAARTGRDRMQDWTDQRSDFFDSVMPEALAVAAESGNNSFLFDAIVVDEGQDFSTTWWLALEMLLRDQADSIFYIFYDDNQLVYLREMQLPVDEVPFALTVNCRNTKYIQAAFAGLYKSDVQVTCQGPEGRKVIAEVYDGSQKGLRSGLTTLLSRLVYVEEVSPEDIVILSSGGLNKPPLSGMDNPGTFQLIDDPGSKDNLIQSTTIRRFKGLERPIVILIVPSENGGIRELLYVGMSRARNHLHLFLPADILEQIRTSLGSEVMFI